MSDALRLPVSIESEGPFRGVATVTLEQPGKPVVVLDHDLLRRLESTLKNLPRDIVGLVLASASERAFVAGADLKAILELDDTQLHHYLSYASGVYALISNLPYPTAAAINGATLGGGLELAMHCDALVGAPPAMREGQPGKPYPVGLPEAGLGLCPGWGGTTMLAARIDPEHALRQTAAGTPMLFDEAVKAGLFDAVSPTASELLTTAKAWVVKRASQGRMERDGAPLHHAGRPRCASGVVRALDALKSALNETGPGKAVLRAVDVGVSKGWSACLESEQASLVQLRHTPEAKAAISAFFAKSKK